MTRARVTLEVVEDHGVVRDGIVRVLADAPEIEVVAAVGDAASALREAARTRPEVALVEVHLPDRSGLEVCRQMPSVSPGTRTLVMSSSPDQELLLEAMLAGSRGLVPMSVDSSTLIAAIRGVAEGATLFDRASLERTSARWARDGTDPDDLTPQEERVLQLVVTGMTNRQVGDELSLAEGTVRNYVSRILHKVGVANRTELTAYVAANRPQSD